MPLEGVACDHQPVAIKVRRESGDAFSAEVIPLPGSAEGYWSSGPLPFQELVQALSERGAHSTDITDAFDAAGIPWPGG